MTQHHQAISPPRFRTRSRPKTLKVALKVNVADQDLVNGRYRQVPSTPAPKPKRKWTRRSTVPSQSTSTNRNKRRRNAKTQNDSEDIITVHEATAQLDDLEARTQEERWQQQHHPDGQLEWPSLSDFEQVSDLSFPMLVSSPSPNGCVAQQTQNSARTTPGHDGARAHGPVHCADCGVPAPINDNVIFVKTNNSNNDNMRSSRTPTPTTPRTSALLWTYLKLRPTRHVNPESNSVTDLVTTSSGSVPQTVGFWYDVTIAEQAKRSDSVDFKMLCLNLMRWRIGNCCENEMVALRAGRGCESNDGDYWNMGREWDLVLADAVAKGKVWRKRRRLQRKECEKAAGWAVWEGRQRRGSRGEFVEDQYGAWVVRAPGFDGEIKRVLCLGYKREGGIEKLTNDIGIERQDEIDAAMNVDGAAIDDGDVKCLMDSSVLVSIGRC